MRLPIDLGCCHKKKLDVLKAGHSSIYAGHPGINKTKEKILSVYYWPGANTDIDQFIKSCEKCQLGKSTLPPKYPLQSLPIPDGPNQRVHIDLMGPLKSKEYRLIRKPK